MATVFNCNTPEEGWALYSHYLGNQIFAISLLQGRKHDGESENEKDKRERLFSDSVTKLVGSLYMIMRRIRENGYSQEAEKMQQIINMTVELDLADPEVREAILKKQKEFDANKRNFDAELARLKAEHALLK